MHFVFRQSWLAQGQLQQCLHLGFGTRPTAQSQGASGYDWPFQVCGVVLEEGEVWEFVLQSMKASPVAWENVQEDH